MSFSELTSTTVFNSILLPCGTSNVEGKTISSVPDLSDKFGNQKTNNRQTNNEFTITLKSAGDTEEKSMAYCQTIDGLVVERKHAAQAAGGVNEYTAQIPSLSLTYGDLTLQHVTVTDGFFLKWLLAGTDEGCAVYAQLVITVGTDEKGKVVYTLNDAFVKSWTFAWRFTVSDVKEAKVLLETVDICYGSMVASVTK